MPQVMQAACPGCQNVLRFPSDWLGQAIRCKHCGTMLQTKAPARTPPPPPAPARAAASTPPPRPAKAPPPPAPREAVKKPVRLAAPVPMATPVAPAPSGDPFSFDSAPEEAPSPRKRRRRGGNGTIWVGLGLMVALMGTTAALAVVYKDKIKQALKESNQLAANKAGDREDDPPVAPQNNGGKAKAAPEQDMNDDPPPAPQDKKKATAVAVNKDKSDAPPLTKGQRKVTQPRDDAPPPPRPPAGGLFPRRALVISVHNYLYSNPVMPGAEGSAAVPGGRDRGPGLIPALNRGLNIPLTQIYHVSDAARQKPLPPLKSVIEESIKNFLATSREQDRIMIFFIGHAKEVEEKAYLVPLEGEFGDASTLIPLEWVYARLKECKARQKILVIDGNRYNAAQGEERPASGAMGEKFEAALKAAPPGVEVWSACAASQQSHELDEAPLGIFLDSLRRALAPERNDKGALEGTIQKPDDLIPLERIQERVAANMTRTLDRRKLKQTALLIGKPPAEGAAYDRAVAAAKEPAFPVFEAKTQQAVKDILAEVTLPPVKSSQGSGADLNFSSLPPFTAEAMKKYEGAALAADSPVRRAIHQARVALWAVSTSTPPVELQGEVLAFRQKSRFKQIDEILLDRYAHPGGGMNENRFKERVFNDSKEMSRVLAVLEEALEELKAAEDEAKEAPPRWQANFVYINSRLQAQLVYLEEYQAKLGEMRKEFPPYDPMVNSGWRMAAKEKATDAAAKKYFKEARKGYDDLAKKHKGTPWEVLGKREALTALALEWQAY